MSLPSVPKPEDATKTVRIQMKSEKNIRNGPTINHDDMGKLGIGELQPGNLAVYWPDSAKIENDTKAGVVRKWYYIQALTGGHPGLSGWAAFSSADFEPLRDTKPLPNIIVPLPPEQPIDATPAPLFTVAPPVPQIDPANILELSPDAPASAAQPDSSAVATDIPKAAETAENEQETLITITSGKDGLVSIVIRPANDRHREFLMTLMETCRVVSNAIVNFGDMKNKTVIEM